MRNDTKTSIQVSMSMKRVLEELKKRNSESYEAVIQRALDDQKTLKHVYKLIDDDEFFERFAELRKHKKEFE